MNYFFRVAGIVLLQVLSIAANAQCDSALYKKLQLLPADTILNISTYDGSGQLVHPDILFLPDSPYFSGFFMVATPYPEYNEKLENPCIYVSNDGLNFIEPIDGVNPLVPTPQVDHNDDPDVTYDSVKKEFNILYLETLRPETQNLVQLTGTPGKEWQKKTIIHFNLKKKEKFIVSPSVVEYSKTIKALFYVSKDFDKKGNNRVEYIISKKGKWNKKKVNVPEIIVPSGFTPWHLDVIKSNNIYFMLLDGFWGNEPVWGEKDINKYTLLLASSQDMIKWNVSPVNIVDCLNSPDKECRYIYRSTSLISGNIMVIWYSYVTMENVWKIGLKKVMLTNN